LEALSVAKRPNSTSAIPPLAAFLMKVASALDNPAAEALEESGDGFGSGESFVCAIAAERASAAPKEEIIRHFEKRFTGNSKFVL
jgi:hypothetical protein